MQVTDNCYWVGLPSLTENVLQATDCLEEMEGQASGDDCFTQNGRSMIGDYW